MPPRRASAPTETTSGRSLSGVPSPIHPTAHAFDGSAAAYERGRPSYPAEVVQWMAGRLGIRPGHTVVDLAAGTGKFTRLLVPLGATVVAVEPVAGMRAELAARVAGVEVLDGTAEAMPLPDASAHAVTVAQAFHWFDGPRALAEIHRVLRDDGRLGLVWNRRDLADPLQADLHPIVNRYRGDVPAHLSGKWREAFETTELFGPFETFEWPWVHEVDEDAAVDRIMSTSIIAALPDAERARVEAQVRGRLAAEPRPIGLRHVTEVYVCNKRS